MIPRLKPISKKEVFRKNKTVTIEWARILNSVVVPKD